MKARILSISFNTLSQLAFSKKAAVIVQSINDPGFPSHFPVINPPQEVVQSAFSQYDHALNQETSGSVAALREATRAELTKQLVLLALDLEQTAKGDMVKLSLTGYDINKSTGGRTQSSTPRPENLRVKQGLSGQIIAKCKAIGGKTFYIGAYTFDPINGPWTVISGVTNSQRIVFSGLERGKDYYFKVMANGPHGEGDWSDVATIMVH